MRLRNLTPLFLITLTTLAHAGPFARYVDSTLSKKLPESSTGMVVMSAKSGKILFSENGNHAYSPASNTKLFTGVAALKQLGPDYRFVTQMMLSPRGNLYVKFVGDPTLKTSDISRMIQTAKQNGLRSIKGNLIIDDTTFVGRDVPIGWSHDDLAYCFAAPVGSVILNQNCGNIKIDMDKTNQMSVVKANDANGLTIINRVTQIPGKKDPKTCVFEPTSTDRNVVTLDGCLRAKREWRFALAIPNPTLYAKQVLLSALKSNGIRFTGQVLYAKAPNNLKVVASHQSEPMSHLVDIMLTYSNNVYAGAITRAIGKSYFGVGSNKAGVSAIEAITEKMIGSPYPYLRLEDGAGGSRYNLVTPLEISRLLLAAYKDASVRPYLMAALPRSGMSGTLTYRMNNKTLLGRIYAKTGTMQGVTTLSGYSRNKSGRVLIFSIMMNGLTGSVKAGRRIQDQLVSRMIRTM